MTRRRQILGLAVLCVAGVIGALATRKPADAYVEAAYSLGRLINESTNIVVMTVEKVDKTNNQIVYRKVRDLKGKHPTEIIKHNIGRAGFHPREWQFTMEWAEVGKTAVFMHNGGASETCIGNYWYQAYAGDWWGMSHAEPFLLRSFAGNPEKLIPLVEAMLAGQEVQTPCMVDGDKMALQLRTARIQRMKASLKINDYDPKRDFVGWGGDDFRVVNGMPGFSHLGSVVRTDPGAEGVSVADIDGDGRDEFLVFGRKKAALFRMEGTSLNEISLPLAGGARSASWADFNGDGKPDLLLATSSGPKVFGSTKEGFKDDTGGLPREAYYNLSSAAWIDADGDKLPDVLLSNGFMGLKVYRNLGPAVPKTAEPKVSPWYYCGPFDNAGGRGFETAYPPEAAVDLKATYDGKGTEKATWKEKAFTDGQVQSLALFQPANNSESVCYLYREFDFGGSVDMPVSLGSDDTLTVWLNGEKLIAESVSRAAAAGQNQLVLRLRPGKNKLLMKICQGTGEWAFYFKAEMPKTATPAQFEDITEKVGLAATAPLGKLRAERLLIADFNGDKRDDVLVTGATTTLLLGSPTGFVESKATGLALPAGTSQPALADFDGDGAIDLAVVLANGSSNVVKLFRNDGKGKFTDVTAQAGDLAKPFPQATSICLADWDRDGRPDVMLGSLRSPNRYFRSTGKTQFTEATAELGLQAKIFNSRAVGIADVNKDGVPDLVLNNEGQDSAVLLGVGKKEVAAK